MKISVCTLIRNRRAHLVRQMEGLALQSLLPTELIIACMQQEDERDLPALPFEVRTVRIPGKRLPLARARNTCATLAKGDLMIFLDVDCIPSPDLVSSFAERMSENVCMMGDVRYLNAQNIVNAAAFDTMWADAITHPAREFASPAGALLHRLTDYGDFWSLCFALSVRTFRASGGFDPAFEGYGGEDTDFGESLRREGIGLLWNAEARAVHQWHPVEKPPFGHLGDIVRNAELFRRKHGRRCMDYWLCQFEHSGHVSDDGRLEVVRNPSADERKTAIQPGHVAFS